MERDEVDKTSAVGTSDDIDSRCAVNSLILDYYKKFGRKRDLEQYFSLSTAQSDIKDTSGLFWRKMKSENDSSDSGGRKSDSSHEVCRISIRCSMPDPSSSQDDDPKTKTDSSHTESPPIIIEEAPVETSRHTDDDSINFDDNNSQKSFDALLDLSAHKPLSPTSSITSQRKLEWDSLADVGYANESDRKHSASSLSTLERLALKQQYSNNDSKQDIGIPTSHSTPLEEDGKAKTKKGVGKKTTKIYKKDVDLVEVNVPHSSNANQAPSINVNLTKHISFNVEKDGGITIENVKSDVSVSPEKVPVQSDFPHPVGTDKEIQTTLKRDDPLVRIDTNVLIEDPKPLQASNQKIPVMISLNTLRKRLRKKKSRTLHKKRKSKKKKEANKENAPHEKSGEPLSEAESFEYMPGHMYNQNQVKVDEQKTAYSTGNKSSLESSQPLTTDSSKGSKHSLTKDLEKCIDLLKVTLQQRYDDSNTKKKLIKDIVHRLVTSKYRDDESTTEFLSGLSFNSRQIGLKGNNTTTSTSDTNNTDDNNLRKPKKSILRNEKFNPNNIASTSQSAPNLTTATREKVNTNLIKTLTSMTDSDASSKVKTSSDNAFTKTSSEELYLKYLEALRREESYKRHLRDKEMFLKQKLASSETAFKVPVRQEPKISSRLQDLMKDLTRNNYDDGSGDASKLEGGSTSNVDLDRLNPEGNQRSHSVFTLSSSHSECPKRPNLKKKMQAERELGEAGPSRDHYCCCPHHYLNSKVGYTDSSVQVNIKYQCEDGRNDVKSCQPKSRECAIVPTECHKCKAESNTARVVSDNVTGEIKYVCMCNRRPASSNATGDNDIIYKCLKLTNRGVQLENPRRLYNAGVQCNHAYQPTKDDKINMIQAPCKLNTATDSSCSDNTSNARRYSKSSQTNMLINMMCRDGTDINLSSASEVKNLCGTSTKCIVAADNTKKSVKIHEATRCLQTEISLDPKISDPKLSDIVIISDCECAKLVSEQLRHVHDDRSESSYKRKTFSDMCTSSTSGKLLIASEESLFKDERRSSKSCNEDLRYASNRHLTNLPPGSEYAVPVQGTNMTLMVNLGAIEVTQKKEQVDQGVVTVQAERHDEATSVIEECTKAAQCTCSVDQNSNHTCSKHSSCNRKSCMVRKMSPENVYRCNTYPKSEPVKEKAPLKRSYTDSGKLGVSSCTQTDKITMDIETNCNRIMYVPEREQKIICCNCETKCQVYRTDRSDSSNNKEMLNVRARGDSPDSESNYVGRGKDSEKRSLQTNFSSDNDSFKKKEKVDPVIRSVSPNAECYNKHVNSVKETEIRSNKCTCENWCQVERNDDKKIVNKDTRSSNDRSESPSSESSNILKNKSSDREPTTKKCTCESSCDVKTSSDSDSFKTKENKITKDRSDSPTTGSYNRRRLSFLDDVPITKSTCENACQVDRSCDNKDKTDSILRTGSPDKECSSQTDKKDVGIQKSVSDEKLEKNNSVKYSSNYKPVLKDSSQMTSKNVGCETLTECAIGKCSTVGCQTDVAEKETPQICSRITAEPKKTQEEVRTETCCNKNSDTKEFDKDPILDIIQDMTRRYSKNDLVKLKKKKCFTEIVAVLNYLLETEDSTDPEPKICCSTSLSTATKSSSNKVKRPIVCNVDCSSEKQADKGIQLTARKSRKDTKECTESSDLPCSTDMPTSSDSTACKVLNKIKKECEKYHQKKCKSGRKCEISSSTSVSCDKCKRIHYCSCKSHKCKRSKTLEKLQKKCIAYNLIIQTSESLLSEETVHEKPSRPLQSIIVKVPKRSNKTDGNKDPQKSEQEVPNISPRFGKGRSRSLTRESVSDVYGKFQKQPSVREYLEQNRPDFVENTSQRQHCLKFISERRNQDLYSPRLKMVVVHQPRCMASKAARQRGGPICYEPCESTCVEPCVPYGPCEPIPCNPCVDPSNMHTMQSGLASARAVQRDLLSLHVEQQPDLTDLSADDLRKLAQQIGLDLRRKKPVPKLISEREMKKHSEKIYKTLPEVVQKKEEKKKENIKKTNLLMANIFKKNLQKQALRGSVNLSNYNTVIKI